MNRDDEGVTKMKKKLNKCPICGRQTFKQDDNMGTYYISCDCSFKAEYDY